MDTFQKIGLFIFIVTLFFSVRKWFESGFWLPKWLHVVAILMFLVGFGLAKLATLSEHPKADLHQWMMLWFPLSVYVIFVLYGGAAAYVRNIGKDIFYHVSMKRKDVLAIFKEYIPQYYNLTIFELNAIGDDLDPIPIQKNKKHYLLYILSTKVIEEDEAFFVIDFELEDITKQKRHIPIAITQLVYSIEAEILLDPLDGI